jgi:sugar porter (SP) family MFS transporter
MASSLSSSASLTTQQRPKPEQEPTIAWAGLCLVFLTPALGGFLYGYDIGATSFVLSILSKGCSSSSRIGKLISSHQHLHHHHYVQHNVHDVDFDNWWKDFDQHQWQQGLTVAAVSAGALIGSHIVLCYLSAVCSRRTELRIAAALYLMGAACNVLSGTVLAHTASATSVSAGWLALLTGRLLTGVGVGFSMHGAPTYMVEMAPSTVRGAVVSAKEAVIVLGIVVGYFAGDIMSSSTSSSLNHWVHLYAISFCMAIPMFVLTFFIPRSKRWLLMHGMRKEAEESMRFVYNGNIRPDFDKMVASIEANRFHKQPSLHSTAGTSQTELGRLFSPCSRPALTAAMGLIALQQFSGQPSIISYATLLFDAAGWNGHVTVVMAILMLAVSSTTVALVDRVGRKRLLLTCCAVLLISLITLSCSFWGWKNGAAHTFGAFEKNIILIAMFAYIGGYQIGFGPITWLVVSEVFPLEVRGAATALGVELNYLLQFLVQFLVPMIQDRFGWGPTFGLFAGSMLFAGFFVHHYVPETAGLTLEQIEDQLTTTDGRDSSDNTVAEVSLSSEQSPLLVIERSEKYEITSRMELP